MSVHKRFSDMDGLAVDDYIQEPPSYGTLLNGLLGRSKDSFRGTGETDPIKLASISNLMKA